MGHYRPPRPRLHEDPMRGVEILYNAIGKIKEGKFRGFSHWTKGVPTPAVHAQRRMGRLRALNKGVEPRLGYSIFEARNHSRYVHAMVDRIEHLHTPRVRSKDSANVNMNPVFLRRPLRKEPKLKVQVEWMMQTPWKKKRKKKNQWNEPTATIPTDQPMKELAPICFPKVVRKHRPGEVLVREDTPLCYTPRPESKLIDGTHLCDRNHYNDAKWRKKFFKGEDVEKVKREYREVMRSPQSPATLTKKGSAWHPPQLPVPTYDPLWNIDMRLADLPSDLQATPSHHTLDDPVRPSSLRKAEQNAFMEPVNWPPRPPQMCNTPRTVPCNTPRTMPSTNTPRSVYSYSPRTVTCNTPRTGPCNTPRTPYPGKHSISPRTPRRPECSSLKHVHLADIKAKAVDSVGPELSYRFGERLRSLPLAAVSNLSLETQTNPSIGTQTSFPSRPANLYPIPEIRSGSPVSPVFQPYESSVTGSRAQKPASEAPVPKSPVSGLSKYKPQDEPPWTQDSCCSTP